MAWCDVVEPRTLRECRIALGQSQTAFAAMLGVSPESYRTWDAGRRATPPKMLARARALATRRNDQALLPLPVLALQIDAGTYLVYDGACGTYGGMLTVAEETLAQLAAQRGRQVATHLYGQEINAETYAIAKADLLLKGEGDAADNIVGGAAYSTLANDAFLTTVRRIPVERLVFLDESGMPFRPTSSTSCSPIRPTARAGRATWSGWAAKRVSRIRAF